MKTNLYVLYGGKSPEHEVSLLSALNIMNALDKDKYNVYPIYITKQGLWCSYGKLNQQLEQVDQLQLERREGSAAESLGGILIHHFSNRDNNVVIPVLHGTNGEDGTVQGMLDLLNIPYVGNGIMSSAVGLDKAMMREVFASAAIPQPEYITIFCHEWKENSSNICDQIEQQIGFPCYVKPANSGSSVGISRCLHRNELERAIELACEYDRKLLVEKEIVGREIQLAVMGNDHPNCSIAGEFIREQSFFDYDKKYVNGNLIQRIPALISDKVYAQMRDMALKAFKALDGSGLMRVDFFLTAHDEIYICEVNTLPGFTQISMFPSLWEKTDGTTYPQLIEKLIALAIERHDRRQGIRYQYVRDRGEKA